MIKDHVTFSARAGNSRKLGSLVALTIGSVVSMTAYAAHGTEAPSFGSRTGALEQIALPPIPYMDKMPWLTWRPVSMKVDTLLSPIPELPRLRVDPSLPDRSGPLPATS